MELRVSEGRKGPALPPCKKTWLLRCPRPPQALFLMDIRTTGHQKQKKGFLKTDVRTGGKREGGSG